MSTNGRLSNYINGQWQDSTAKEFADVINPATGETLAQVPLDGEADIASAIESAAAAFPEWRRTPPEDRIQYLFKLKQLFEEHVEDLARLITTENGKVTAAILSSNREVQAWASSLRSRVFSAVPGLTGTISRLENLGIDFASTSSTLSIKDGTKLDTALRDKSSDVAAFFQTATTGLAKSMDSYLTILGTQSTDAQKRLTKSNTDLDAQIATIERRLTAQRSALEASFIAMESAQASIKSQGDALTKAFGSSS